MSYLLESPDQVSERVFTLPQYHYNRPLRFFSFVIRVGEGLGGVILTT